MGRTARQRVIGLGCAWLVGMAGCLGVNGNGDEDTAGAAAAAGVAAARHADSVANAVRQRVASSAGTVATDTARGSSRPDTTGRR